MNPIKEHLGKIIATYTSGNYYDLLIQAKDQYVKLTGRMDEDRDEYESRMNNFNDWFIFNFKRDDGRRIIDDYIQDNDIDPELAKAFHNIKYSVFHFQKINFRDKIIFKDLLHDETIKLSKSAASVGMVVDDIFVGRVINYQNENYLLDGICMLPGEILSIIKKQSKKVRQTKDDEEEINFLIKLELLKTKSLHYGHIDYSKIFVFN